MVPWSPPLRLPFTNGLVYEQVSIFRSCAKLDKGAIQNRGNFGPQ
jgi:hypothetical protein